VDDPSERVDKTDGRPIENTACLQQDRPLLCQHFAHNGMIIYNNKGLFFVFKEKNARLPQL
jgi:hypothetical protein